MRYPACKRGFDVVGACILFLLVLPLLLIVGVAILIEDGRPVFFWQERVGYQGRCFRLLKFRTLQTGEHDPKRPEAHTTTVGTWLRRYAIDELPQLWNVICGEMSLVGPRPILPSEAAQYNAWERTRLTVRPGLTGWAQIQGRNALPWYRRIELDIWYVEHRSFRLDLAILLRTPGILLSGRGVYGPGNKDPEEQDFAVHRQGSE